MFNEKGGQSAWKGDASDTAHCLRKKEIAMTTNYREGNLETIGEVIRRRRSQATPLNSDTDGPGKFLLNSDEGFREPVLLNY